jgi:hypothetical protein
VEIQLPVAPERLILQEGRINCIAVVWGVTDSKIPTETIQQYIMGAEVVVVRIQIMIPVLQTQLEARVGVEVGLQHQTEVDQVDLQILVVVVVE